VTVSRPQGDLVRVYKVGGPALEDPGLVAPLADEIRAFAGRVVVVHGGGRNVERMLGALSIESRFVEGRRATSPAAMEVVEMVLSGTVNKALASALTRAGLRAVGVSGRDGGLVGARLEAGLGRVGVPEGVDPRLLRGLWAAGFVPVVSPVADGPSGESTNVNADETALGIATALGAASLIYLSDVDGVRVDGRDADRLSSADAERFILDGSISGGMVLKVRAALDAGRGGIDEVVIAGKARLMGGFPGTRLETPARAEVGA
jgi:acetylglutamate kinase